MAEVNSRCSVRVLIAARVASEASVCGALRCARMKSMIGGIVAFNKRLDDANLMVELVEAATPAEQEDYAKELNSSVASMVDELDKLEIGSFLTGQFDRNNAIFSIQAGAGVDRFHGREADLLHQQLRLAAVKLAVRKRRRVSGIGAGEDLYAARLD